MIRAEQKVAEGRQGYLFMEAQGVREGLRMARTYSPVRGP